MIDRVGRRVHVAGAAAAATVVVLAAMVLPGSAVPPAFTSVPSAVGGFEPGVDISPTGAIYVNAPVGLPGHSLLSRSTNGGASFQRLSFTVPESWYPGGGDSDVVVTTGPDGKDRIYFLDLSGLSNSIAVSLDGGDTWSYGSPLTTLPLSDRQWIALGERDPATGIDVVYIVYQMLNPPNWLMFARSDDGGLTWPVHRPVPGIIGASGGPPGNLVSDGDFVGFPIAGGGQVRFVYSTDGGLLDWNVSEVSFLTTATGAIPSAALDGDRAYATWTEGPDHAVRVARSADRGQSWSDIDYVNERLVAPSSPGTSNVFPWIAARTTPSGPLVAVAWYSTPAADPAVLSPDAQSSGQWRLTYSESTDGVNWTEPASAHPAVVLHGGVCTSGLGCGLPGSSGSRALGDFLQIALDAAGRAVISFGDRGTGRVAVRSA